MLSFHFAHYSLFLFLFIIFFRSDRPASSSCIETRKSPHQKQDQPDCPALTQTKTNSNVSPSCCTCFGPFRPEWDDASSGQMSEVYSRPCDTNIDSPSCLNHVLAKTLNANDSGCRRTVLTVESMLELPNVKSESESKVRAGGIAASSISQISSVKCKPNSAAKTVSKKSNKNDNDRSADEVFELANDVTSCTDLSADEVVRIISRNDCMIRVQGKEELPASPADRIQLKKLFDGDEPKDPSIIHSEEENVNDNRSSVSKKQIPRKTVCTDSHPLLGDRTNANDKSRLKSFDDFNGNNSKLAKRVYSTLPRAKKSSIAQQMVLPIKRSLKSVPTRTTPDGTTIYYWCDLSKQTIKGCSP